jgi:DNA-binding winged helix-turn-helix (wHTH) protein
VTQGRVVLANELPFWLGTVRVDPPMRQIVFSDTSQTVEPRAMQVLVLLKKADGGVVSREALIAQCWNGRIVGDDAINHAVAKLRRLAEQSGGQFEIETIARVGFRLIEKMDGTPGDGPPTVPPQPATAGFNRRALIRAAAVAGVVGLGGAAVAFRSGRETPADLAEVFYQRGLATRGQGYSTQYEQAVGYFQRAVELDPDHAAAWGGAQLVLPDVAGQWGSAGRGPARSACHLRRAPGAGAG